MIPNKTFLCLAAFTACLLIGISCGQDWLEGGYVSSSRTSDPGIAGMVLWLDQAVPNYRGYTTGGAIYPGPFGIYPFNPMPYYSDNRLNSLAGMNWEPYQKNWSETMNYAQTRSSFRVNPAPAIAYTNPYPVVHYPGPGYSVAQTPAAASGDSTATVVSQGMRGYQVFLDGSYIGTEGTGGDPLDGRFSFRVVGGQNHDIRVYDGQFNYPKTMFFERGGTKIINVEPGTALYI
jgi:hypothetical protein